VVLIIGSIVSLITGLIAFITLLIYTGLFCAKIQKQYCINPYVSMYLKVKYLIKGPLKKGQVDPSLIISIPDKFFPCLPSKIKKILFCGFGDYGNKVIFCERTFSFSIEAYNIILKCVFFI